MEWVWTWAGKSFGWTETGSLWTHSGKHAGQFRGTDVYAADGRYLGEVIDGRLITNIAKKSLRGARFKPFASKTGYVPYSNYVGYVMYAGYEEFPPASSF